MVKQLSADEYIPAEVVERCPVCGCPDCPYINVSASVSAFFDAYASAPRAPSMYFSSPAWRADE